MRTFLKAELYITGLQDAQGKSAIEGLKKTVFLGLPIRMNSVMATFDRLESSKPARHAYRQHKKINANNFSISLWWGTVSNAFA